MGYLKGGRDLRQGDPLSPSLFVISMEAFTRLFHSRVQNSSYFKFHPLCKELQLTHLSFADDLLIFTAADPSSIQLVKNALLDFEKISGLAVNPSKSEIFCAATSEHLKNQILEILNFKEGKLPVRYLGMPLLPGKLSLKDCQPVLDKILARINTWSNRKLSFAGRLQLLQSVLYSTQSFWCSIYLHPSQEGCCHN